MPRQTGRSGLASKVDREEFDKYKGDETTLAGGGSDLPAGIEGGVAQLVECKFGKYEKGDNVGEYFFLAAGVVVSPAEYDGVLLVGLRTQIGPEPMCDTPKSLGKKKTKGDHIEWILNQMRLLGLDTAEADWDYPESVAEALKETKPYFRFRTWKGQKQTTGQYAGVEPRTQHDWRGYCEYNSDDTGDDVVDSAEESGEEYQEPEAVGEPSTDWNELGTLADPPNDDEEAIEALTVEAEALGIDHGSLATWVEVAEQIVVGQSTDSSEGQSEEPEEFVPVKDRCYWFKPPRYRKFDEFELTALFEGTQTCNLKRLSDKRIFKSVSWDDLKLEKP